MRRKGPSPCPILGRQGGGYHLPNLKGDFRMFTPPLASTHLLGCGLSRAVVPVYAVQVSGRWLDADLHATFDIQLQSGESLGFRDLTAYDSRPKN